MKKIISTLGIVFFATAALAEKAYEFDYKVRSNKNGQIVSEGTFVAIDDRINQVQIQNPASSLNMLNISIDTTFKTTMPGGDGYDFIETKIDARGIHLFSSNDVDGNATFADGKVTGELKVKRVQSFYYQNASGVTLDFDAHKIKSGTCVGGNILDASKAVKRFDSSAIASDEGIEFHRTLRTCLSYSDDTDDHGGRICNEWNTEIQHIALPACAN